MKKLLESYKNIFKISATEIIKTKCFEFNLVWDACEGYGEQVDFGECELETLENSISMLPLMDIDTQILWGNRFDERNFLKFAVQNREVGMLKIGDYQFNRIESEPFKMGGYFSYSEIEGFTPIEKCDEKTQKLFIETVKQFIKLKTKTEFAEFNFRKSRENITELQNITYKSQSDAMHVFRFLLSDEHFAVTDRYSRYAHINPKFVDSLAEKIATIESEIYVIKNIAICTESAYRGWLMCDNGTYRDLTEKEMFVACYLSTKILRLAQED